MRYVIGVDGGGSKTHALVLEETGRVVGFGQGGIGNHQIRGLKPAMHEVSKAVSQALTMAGLPVSPVALGVYSLAGADLPEDYDMLQRAVAELGLSQGVIITNDTMAALRSGISRPWGVVLICGTGFNAAGRAPDGREVILPGLGAISGDWGGGMSLGYEMVRAVMRAWDGRGKPTRLTQAVLGFFDAATPEILLRRLYHQEIDERCFHTLSPLLFEVAEAGDEVSREIVIRLGTELGISARAIIRRLGLEKEDVEVILGGSVFKGKGSLLVDTIRCNVHEEAPLARILMPRYAPVVGAGLLALEALGIEADKDVYRRLEEHLPRVLAF